ncbi:family 1 glycosylhydrolase [Paenibacillus sp. DMB5]|uniref:glycoside hydrolase family 1 protein n=1 Tax=Paenibacillus sp. DMB5 TaxID=1780103 RepID=UPI00076C2284|nr:family 1 glycosylhydrolase [Paenibacillus sp. DMB5]KUP23525.1 glycoside hydrolase family 1 [Paenibacillus sp. DMB5]
MGKFPEHFMIGAATAAHQVEGHNIYSDFWAMEHAPHSVYKEPSLDAVDHYNRYEEDILLLKEAGCNAYRFSVEWARIEPQEGDFSVQEIAHYRDVLNFCHQQGITPVVTLHHFSSPKWLISAGGWENEATIEAFGRYCRHVVSELGGLIPYICTINEANMGKQITKIMKRMMGGVAKQKNNAEVQVGLNTDLGARMEHYYRELGEIFGIHPGQVQPFLSPRTEQGERIIMKCHETARSIIKELHPEIQVGITFSLYDHQALPGGEAFVQLEQQEDFLVYLPYLQGDDFLGVQNYSRKIHGPDGVVPPDASAKLTKMGYENYPQALGNVLDFVSEHWNKPIFITENGLSGDNDKDRVTFIKEALKGVQERIARGLPVIGYTYWSLLDNFEWQLGYDQTFGLIAVDRSTQTRHPKESLSVLGGISKAGL